jgi:hypothetical protein
MSVRQGRRWAGMEIRVGQDQAAAGLGRREGGLIVSRADYD